MPEFNWLTAIFGGVGVTGFVTAVWAPVRDWRSGNLRKGRTDADRAAVEVDQLVAAGPLAADGTRISQSEQTVIIQGRALTELGLQLTAANLRVAERDRQLAESDILVAGLRSQVRDRDAQIADRDGKIDELEDRLGRLEDELRSCRSIITQLREAPGHTPPSPPL